MEPLARGAKAPQFKSLKNIETSFRQIRLFGIVMVSLCAFIAIGSVVLSLNFAEKQREKYMSLTTASH